VVRRLPPLFAALAIAVALAPSAQAARYRVRWGDSLGSIATRFHTTVSKLARANGLDPTRFLLAGTTIRVPGSTSGAYRVRVGDTLSGLAARFGTSVSALAAANHIDPNGVLFAGIRLRLPGSVAYAPASYARPAARSLPGRYRVRPGDSLGAIASRFGTTVAALAAANRLDPRRYLLAGITIAVPAGAAARSSAESRPPLSHGQVRTLIVYWAGRYGVPYRLALALAWMESGYQTSVVSSAGAFGPMQVTPATRQFVEAVLVGAPIAHTTSGDVQVGVAYLHYLLRRFGGSERLALAGYFQGPASVRKGLLPVTKAYIADIRALEGRV
jgi:LysM repeat protein